MFARPSAVTAARTQKFHCLWYSTEPSCLVDTLRQIGSTRCGISCAGTIEIFGLKKIGPYLTFCVRRSMAAGRWLLLARAALEGVQEPLRAVELRPRLACGLARPRLQSPGNTIRNS